jgi:hypothetical protein
MKIFLAHAAEDVEVAESTYYVLSAQKHTVFFDRESIDNGSEVDNRILDEISKSDFVVFLISPDSTKQGRYCRTELETVKEKWPHPAGKVLPVMIRDTDSSSLPPYLKAVNIMHCSGDAAAEIGKHIFRLSARAHKQRRLIYATLAAGACFLLALSVTYSLSNQTPKYPRNDGLIADFSMGRGGPARNAVGESFGLISDSEFNGSSKVWYKLEWGNDNGNQNGFLRLFYQLEQRSTPGAEPYVGLYTDFSYPPPGVYDISSFSSVSLRIRSSAPVPEGMKISVSLASSNIPAKPGSYDFPEYVIPSMHIAGSWQELVIPLVSFKAPMFSDRKNSVLLDPRKVFRWAIAIKSEGNLPIHGYIDIDEIRLL